jgi:predicted metal-dependent peptidase
MQPFSEVLCPPPRVEKTVNASTSALRVVQGDEKGTRWLAVYLDHPVTGGTYIQRPGPPAWELEAGLTTSLCKKMYYCEIERSENQTVYSKEGYGSKRAVLPVLMMMMMMSVVLYFQIRSIQQ